MAFELSREYIENGGDIVKLTQEIETKAKLARQKVSEYLKREIKLNKEKYDTYQNKINELEKYKINLIKWGEKNNKNIEHKKNEIEQNIKTLKQRQNNLPSMSQYDDKIYDRILQDKMTETNGAQHYEHHIGEQTFDELFSMLNEPNNNRYTMSTFITKYAMFDCTLAAIEHNAAEIAYRMIKNSLTPQIDFKYDMTQDTQNKKGIKNAIGYGLVYDYTDKNNNIITETKCSPIVKIRLRRTGNWSFAVRTAGPDLDAPKAFVYQSEDKKDFSKMNENLQNKYTNIKLNELDENELSL